MELEGINYTVRYRRGSENLAADYLSRNALTFDSEVNDETENLEQFVYTVRDRETRNTSDRDSNGSNSLLISLESTSFLEDLRSGQALDPVISSAVNQMQERGNVVNGRFKKFRGMRVENGILYRKRQIVIPGCMVDQVIHTIHNNAYWGIQRTFDETKRRVYWRGMFKDIETFCSSCEVCLKSKRGNSRRQPLVPIELPYNFPRAMVSFDIATLPWSANGFRYILVITDMFS